MVFFGRRELKPSLKWMGAFWLSVAGAAPAPCTRARPETLLAVRRGGCMVACLLPKELYQVARARVRGCAPSALCPMPYALCALCAPAGTIASFYDIEPTAGLLMVPTQVCVWRGCTCPDGSKLLAHGLLHRLSSLRNP